MFWQNLVNDVLSGKSRKYYIFESDSGSNEIANKPEQQVRKRLPGLTIILSDTNQQISLSRRESECCYYMLLGHTCRDIALKSSLSVRTIEFYMSNIKQKMHCRRKSQLVELLLVSNFMYHYKKLH